MAGDLSGAVVAWFISEIAEPGGSDMRKKRSLIQIYLVSMIALAAVPVAINGAIWIATEYESFTEQSANLRKTFVESRTELLKREVGKAVDYIEYKNTQLDRRLYQELRQEVSVALALLGNIHKEAAATENQQQIQARVRNALAPLRFHQQKGFYFALTGAGETVLAPLHPESRERLRQGAILKNFAEQVRNATREKNQNFLEFRFTEAGSDLSQRNISFVYYYQPLDLYVGASVYLRDEVERIQQEVIERLSALPYDTDSSVLMVTDSSGKQLVNPYNLAMVGKLQPGMAEVAKELQKAGSPKATLVELECQRIGGKGVSPAVTYVSYQADWNWLVGAGFFLDEYHALMQAERQALEARVLRHTLFISSVALVLMLVATLVARRLARLNAQGFHRFQEFFALASERSTQIDVSELPFAEFEELARHANDMVDTRSQTEYALKLSERRFQLALDASQSHLWDLDMKGDVIAVGEGFYKTLGYPYPAGGVPMQRFGSIFHRGDFAEMRKAFSSADVQDKGVNIEFRVRDNAGVYRWILTRGDIVETGENGTPVRAMGIMSDISDRKRMEAELVAARIAAEDANHAKSQFLSSASHELRTPLNGVLGYVQLLQRQKKLPKESQGYLDAIENCGQHLLNLINDVLDLAKVESGTVNVSLHTANLRNVLTGVGDILRQRADAKNLGYEHKISAKVPELVRTDEVKLRQILVNLLGNAVKFTDSGKITLDVDFDREHKTLLFSVIDTGAGIPADKIKDIFEPFRRVNEHDGKGTGLGLSICRRLCEAMGGKLSVSSEVGRGTVFSFDIPLPDDALPEQERRRQLKSPAESEPRLEVSGLSVIVADDNDDNRRVLEGMLEGVAETVYAAADGRDVLALLDQHSVDLVLMDYRMPEMDGLECTSRIKSNPDFKDTVVIMVTASAGPDTESKAFEAGCDAYLSKPVQMDQLVRVIAEHSGKSVMVENDKAKTEIAAAPPANGNQTFEGDPLPPEETDALLELLALGDIAAMNEFCKTRESGNYAGFVQLAQSLLQNFDFQGLKNLLNTHRRG